MTKLTRGLLVSVYDQRDTEMLGDTTNEFAAADVNKPVVYAGVQMDLAVSTNEMVGFVEVIDPATSDGHSVGTVKKTGRVRVTIGAGEVGTLAEGGLVVADTQVALGTAGEALVMGGAPVTYKWAVVWLDGDGTAGTTCVIERVQLVNLMSKERL